MQNPKLMQERSWALTLLRLLHRQRQPHQRRRGATPCALAATSCCAAALGCSRRAQPPSLSHGDTGGLRAAFVREADLSWIDGYSRHLSLG